VNFLFWLLTLGALDDIRRQGLTSDERQAENDQAWFVIIAGLSLIVILPLLLGVIGFLFPSPPPY
jgi:hypothetical protein